MTTNRTAGATPYPTLENLAKRKIEAKEEQSGNKIVRKKIKQFQSHATKSSMNKLYYSYLPDGFIVAYATKGRADGEPGYLSPAIKLLNSELGKKQGDNSSFAEQIQVASVLHLRDPKTLTAKTIDWNKYKTKLKVMGLVGLIDEELTNNEADQWCNRMVNVFNDRFPEDPNNKTSGLKISFGGNGAKAGMPILTSIAAYSSPKTRHRWPFPCTKTQF